MTSPSPERDPLAVWTRADVSTPTGWEADIYLDGANDRLAEILAGHVILTRADVDRLLAVLRDTGAPDA